jgi:hypothetical protein
MAQSLQGKHTHKQRWNSCSLICHALDSCAMADELVETKADTAGEEMSYLLLCHDCSSSYTAVLVLHILPLRIVVLWARVAKEVRKQLPTNYCVNVCHRQANACK